MYSHRPIATLAIALLAGLAGCASYYEHQADEDAGELLENATRRVETERTANLVTPTSAPIEGEEEPLPPPEVPAVMTLDEALRLAVERNREYRTQREGLLLSALTVLGVRNQFAPRFSSSLAYGLGDGTGTRATQTGSLDLGVSQILPTGGDASLTGRTSATHDDDDVDPGVDFASSVTARLSQPLLRGAGYETRHEPLTQAERNLVYTIRSYELFRQDFTIRITRRFFDLVGQKTIIENNRQSLEGSRFERERSKRFFDVGRGTKLDMLRAEQDYLRAEDRLNRSVESFEVSLDRFKIDLGLPLDVEFEIAFDPPEFQTLDVSLSSAVRAALANRLDLRSSREQLADAERAVRIARQSLLPSLELSASYAATFPTDRSFLDQGPMNSRYDLGISLEIPLDRVSERNAYRRSLVSLSREQRQVSLDEDNVIQEVRDALRSLKRLETTIRIQELTLESEKKRLRLAEIELEAGKIGNREKVEAKDSLLDAQNDIVQQKVDYAVERLRLLRTVGTLFLDENGVPVR